MKSAMRAAFAAIATLATGSVADLTGEALAMVNDATEWMDKYYDPEVAHLYDVESKSAMGHETLSSTWYAVGLLARNGNDGDDAVQADAIIQAVIADQKQNPEDLWYGNYAREPEEPTVGSEHYPAKQYQSWDPNWRGFVGLSFITMYEDFGDLLPDDTKELMLESLYNCSVGDAKRGGGENGDNLWPAYSNPAIMRAVGTGWTGRKLNNSDMIEEGEGYAREIIELWDMHETLSEFNSATYTGISLFGLIHWAKYMPESSIMAERGPDMIKGTMETIAQLWHSEMRNLAGPWDRSYSFDTTIHLGHLSLLLAPIVGRKESGLRSHPEIMSHARDWCWAPLMAVHSEFFRSLLPEGLEDSLKSFDEDRTWEGKAYYPPYDLEARNITTWLSKDLIIGAQSYRCESSNGPSNNNGQFHPVTAQWTREGDSGTIGWLSLRSSQAHVTTEVSPNRLKITYPEGDAESKFAFFVSPSLQKKDVAGWADIQGVSITVSGNVDPQPAITFGGHYGGAHGAYYDHNYWRLEHKMPEGFSGTPELVIDFD